MVTINHVLSWFTPDGTSQRVYMILFAGFAVWDVLVWLLRGKRDARDDQGEKDASFLMTLSIGMLLSRVFCDWNPFSANPWPFYVAGVVGIILGAIAVWIWDSVFNTVAKIRREISQDRGPH